MKKILVFLLIGMTLSACKKTPTCVPPASGDTPFTVVEGMELGMPLDIALLCPALDTVLVVRPEYNETVARGIYAGIPVRYTIWTDTMNCLHEVEVFALTLFDTAATRQAFESFIAYNQTKYGSGKKEVCFSYKDLDYPYARYSYTWQICDGTCIDIWPTSTFRNWERDPHLPYEGILGDTLVRYAQVRWHIR